MTSTPSTVSIVIPTYRDPDRTSALVRKLRQQDRARDVVTEILVMDDGSEPEYLEPLVRSIGADATVHGLHANLGRAAARNAGAHLASSDAILFLDSDCLPAGDDLTGAHLRAWRYDTVATVGPITGVGGDFWDLYQREASTRRARQLAAGVAFAGTSANLMVSRDAFQRSGGFDEGYRGYGFEDRDFLLRIASIGAVRWATDATVIHTDALTLAGVCTKMAEAGGDASARFSRRYPDAYARLGYALLDSRRHRLLAPIARLIDRHLIRMTAWWEPLLRSSIPFLARRLLVKVMSALAFLGGTSRRSASP